MSTQRKPVSAAGSARAVPAAPSAVSAVPRRAEPTRAPTNHQMQSLLRARALQAKLTVSQPGDALERQADAMADRVTRGASSFAPAHLASAAISSAPQVQRRCAACEDEIQRKPSGEAGAARPHARADNASVVPGTGEPLPRAVRDHFEPRFGADFSGVRVHTGERADHSARALNAQAYTMRNDIVFAKGRYAPHTHEGRWLLAHELTHTMQQQAGGAERVQRRMGDGHDLTATRFLGNRVLEAVYDGERVLRKGDSGPAVRLLQQALLDSGMELPRFGVDGKFGPETEAAVKDLQHASGLLGADIDGIVGPTTMGWLDQAFSAGPTPAGTTRAATTGCATIKTLNVDVVTMDGSTRDGVQQLERANTIFNQCCVHFNLSGGGSVDAATTSTLMGGTNILNKSTACGSSTADERRLVAGLRSMFSLSGRFLAIFVRDTSPAVLAYSFPPFCATGGATAMAGVAVLTNNTSVRGLGHELGHHLLNNANHPATPANLMAAVATPPGEQLTAADCTTIFANA